MPPGPGGAQALETEGRQPGRQAETPGAGALGEALTRLPGRGWEAKGLAPKAPRVLFCPSCSALQLTDAFEEPQFVCFLEPTNTCFETLSPLPIFGNQFTFHRTWDVSRSAEKCGHRCAPVSSRKSGEC